jgi:adenine-specific DNA-methyltransferase
MKKDYSGWGKEELIREINSLKKRKKYGLVWDEEREPEKVVLDCKEKLPVLKEVKDKEIATDKKQPTNILIEGDNYHTLSVLNYTHKGKIDVIYIDPPYNTGNDKEWKYNDKYVNREDAYRHSKWLSFIQKRLILAKNLLSKKGAIFISINYIELSNLILLMDEIFGEKNFVQLVTIESATTASFRTINTCPVNVAEYLVIYAKDRDSFRPKEVYRESKYSEDYSHFIENFEKHHSLWKLINIDEIIYRNSKVKDWKEFKQKYGENWKEMRYQLKADFCNKNRDRIVSLNTLQKPSDKIQKIIDESKQEKGKVFCYEREQKNNIYVYNGRTLAFYKNKFRIVNGKEVVSEILTNIWDDISFLSLGHEGEVDFLNGKKPMALIKRVIKIAGATQNSTILDFFAGSGTTGHAVLELNKEESSNMGFILCTNNENNICTDMCYPRIEKAIKGHKKNGEPVSGLGGNLKHFCTDFIGASPTDKNKRDLVNKCTEMLCLKENAFELVKKGDNFRIFKDSHKHLGIIYDEESISEFKKEAKKINGNFIVYVFSLDQSAHEERFKDMKGRVKLNPIPEVILAVYRRIFK